MAASRYYSSVAGLMTLNGAISAGTTAATLNVATGLPGTVPYTLMIDPGLSTEELVEVTAIGGLVITISRGINGTSAQSHLTGAEVRHCTSARDFQDSRDHEANTATAHGVTGAVVGTTNTQTLTNKTIAGTSNTLSAIPSAAVTGLDTHIAATTAHGATGAVVGTTNAQTLTNKTITAPAGLVKGDVGLGNVDNTSDANKPVSTAQNLKDVTFVAPGTPLTGVYASQKVKMYLVGGVFSTDSNGDTVIMAGAAFTGLFSGAVTGGGGSPFDIICHLRILSGNLVGRIWNGTTLVVSSSVTLTGVVVGW